ncbi:MAG TPA: ABC transporter permease [Thermoanaerobaculia bacterium]|nr:ABC transporter permease [Thermoanaerobaculia bacterium]
MNKMFAVFKREYLQAVRKKMFIIMTFLMPVFIVGLFLLPGLMMERGMGTKKIAVLDGTGQLREAIEGRDKSGENDIELGRASTDLPGQIQHEYVNATGNIDDAAKPYLERMNTDDKKQRLDGVFLVPPDALTTTDAKLKYYSRSATDFITQQRISEKVNRGVQQYRLSGRGIAAADVDQLLKKLPVESVQLSKTGEQKKGGVANFLIGFMLVGLMLIPSFVYGLEIMRGIIQEKTDRVVEVLISSVTPAQLLIGKILGVAAVGLTQISVWFAMAGIAGAIAATSATLAGMNVTQLIRPMTFVYFVIFFLLAYLTYVCVYAIGGAVCNSEKEAQQLIAPITMIMMLPWFLMAGILTNPESSLSVGFSLAPVFGPLTMYVRTLVSEPPLWHVLLSIGIAVTTIALFFWVTAKIFRVGILSYGKRPTIPELIRWIKVA